MKEHVRKCTGVEHVNTLDKGIIKEMQVAHSNYINRKKEEEAERLLSEARKKRTGKRGKTMSSSGTSTESQK